MNFPLLPLLSEEDKAETSEGGLDPLGLVQVAEALAIRLVPGVRERMSHPRYLTAMAVGMEVCSSFSEEALAKDGISPPWLVFEWIVVEAFVRTAEGRDGFKLPGSDKAAVALREGVPLSANRYLKTPNVFGFHGVYRGLARELEIESADRLGETGYALLTTWAGEQGLQSFTGSGGGGVYDDRANLYYAVKESRDAREVARRENWQYWDFIRKHLAPNRTGPREAKVLSGALFSDTSGFRREVLRFLVSDHGCNSFEKSQSERAFHNELRQSADRNLAALLDAIMRYEKFSRVCQDAFDDALVEMTRSRGSKVTLKSLAKIQSVQAASKSIPDQFQDLLEKLEPYPETSRFYNTFAALAERLDTVSWAERLLGHHVAVQRRKAPVGKNPWFERYDDGSVMIRPLYRTERRGRHDESYVHAYRTGSLYSFARDLRLFDS